MTVNDIKNSLNWTFRQTYQDFVGEVMQINKHSPHQIIVDHVRKYFNDNNIDYDLFSWDDMKPHL